MLAVLLAIILVVVGALIVAYCCVKCKKARDTEKGGKEITEVQSDQDAEERYEQSAI